MLNGINNYNSNLNFKGVDVKEVAKVLPRVNPFPAWKRCVGDIADLSTKRGKDVLIRGFEDTTNNSIYHLEASIQKAGVPLNVDAPADTSAIISDSIPNAENDLNLVSFFQDIGQKLNIISG